MGFTRIDRAAVVEARWLDLIEEFGERDDVEYPGHYLVKRITSGGTFRFGRRLLFLATPLQGYDVGLDKVDEGIWSIYFCNVLIARFDERKYVIRS